MAFRDVPAIDIAGRPVATHCQWRRSTECLASKMARCWVSPCRLWRKHRTHNRRTTAFGVEVPKSDRGIEIRAFSSVSAVTERPGRTSATRSLRVKAGQPTEEPCVMQRLRGSDVGVVHMHFGASDDFVFKRAEGPQTEASAPCRRLTLQTDFAASRSALFKLPAANRRIGISSASPQVDTEVCATIWLLLSFRYRP